MKTMCRFIALILATLLLLPALACAEADDVSLAERQSLGLEMVWNDRQLGGYAAADGRRVKDGLLLWAGRLSDASEADVALLCDTYGLKTVVDLRNDGEVNAHPDVDLPGVTYMQVTLYGTPEEEGFDNPVYIRYLATGTAKAGYKRLFDALLATEEGAFLWHCKSGKDRTGLAAMLILTALGADEETIMRDFLLTNIVNESEPDMPGAGAVKEEDMRQALDYLAETYGSVMGYITDGLGVTEDEIRTLRDRYLEDA